MSRYRRRAVYLMCAGTFVVLALEGLLRIVAPDPEYYWNYRFSFVSPKVFENRGDGLWTYRPHASIREVAVYATAAVIAPHPRFVVEYDCRMRSNNLGLLQDDDVAPGTRASVIVGDSFTAGQGGCPWFDRLQSRRKDDRLVNGGLMGTGVEQWRRLVVHLQRSGIAVKRLLIIAIGNDFKRQVFNWTGSELACLDDMRCPPDTDSGLWQPVADDESDPQLIARTATRFSQRFADAGVIEFLRMYLKQHSYLFKFLDLAGKNLRVMLKGSGLRAIGIRPENEAALDALKAQGIPLRVLMVTQRDEVGTSGNYDSKATVAVLEAHSVPYSWCRLAAGDFMPNDGHPNRAGYDKLAACADEALDRMEQPGGPGT